MSYRTSVNGCQIFGNNESYEEWNNFIKSKGIKIGEDGDYDGEIYDIMGMFEVIDKITRRLITEQHQRVIKGETNFKGEPELELTDLSRSIWLNDDTPILMYNQQMIEYAYCFLPYQVLLAVKDKIEYSDEVYDDSGIDWFGCSYKLKDGEKIIVHAG